MRAVVIPSASIRATSFSPSGDDRGFVLDEMLCAVISRSANHPSSATCSVDTRLPPDLIISASRRIASDPLTRSMRIDAVRVRRAQRIDHLDGVGVVDFFGPRWRASSTSPRTVAITCAPRECEPCSRLSGRSRPSQRGARRGDAQQLERPERGYRRDRQRGCLFVSDAVRIRASGSAVTPVRRLCARRYAPCVRAMPRIRSPGGDRVLPSERVRGHPRSQFPRQTEMLTWWSAGRGVCSRPD